MSEERTTLGAGPSGAAASPATISRATRALLLCGVAASPLFAVAATTQILTRQGFSLRRNAASVLSNGDLGWIQISNYLVTGLLFLAGAVGMRQVMRSGRGGTWGPRLIGAFGIGLMAAGVFRPDPANGFPPGAPPGNPKHPSWHSNVHFTVATLAFLALIVACLVVARGFASHQQAGWAAYSAAMGLALLGATVAIAAQANKGTVNVVFYIVAVLTMGWVSALAGWLLSRLPSAGG
jgi:hypothetical membrane protein